MIGLVFAFIGYLFASTGHLGGDMVYALDVMENWYWIVLVILSIFALIPLLVFGIMGAAAGSTVSQNMGGLIGMFMGSAFGIVAGLVMVFRTILQLWIISWLMGSIDPQAASFDAFTTNQIIGLVALVIMAMFSSKVEFKGKK
jgi:hypothetical protein